MTTYAPGTPVIKVMEDGLEAALSGQIDEVINCFRVLVRYQKQQDAVANQLRGWHGDDE